MKTSADGYTVEKVSKKQGDKIVTQNKIKLFLGNTTGRPLETAIADILREKNISVIPHDVIVMSENGVGDYREIYEKAVKIVNEQYERILVGLSKEQIEEIASKYGEDKERLSKIVVKRWRHKNRKHKGNLKQIVFLSEESWEEYDNADNLFRYKDADTKELTVIRQNVDMGILVPTSLKEFFELLRDFGEFDWEETEGQINLYVEPVKMGWWIGKDGRRIKAIQSHLNKRVKVLPGKLVYTKEYLDYLRDEKFGNSLAVVEKNQFQVMDSEKLESVGFGLKIYKSAQVSIVSCGYIKS